MGYTTTFEGELEIFPSLKPEQVTELNRFCRLRHSQRVEEGRDANDNREASYAPGLHCDWETDGFSLSWNGSEKSYDMFEWVQLLNERFFKPWGCTLEGEVVATGQRPGDVWCIRADGASGLRKVQGRLVFQEK
jgi:hypothetical protein